MGDMVGVYMVLIGRPEGNPYLEDLGVDGMIILKGYARRRMGWPLLKAVVNLSVP
jgi:hypothetical protein